LDLAIAVALAFVGFALTLVAVERFQTPFPDNDVWFGTDIPRLIANITDLGSDQSRARVHPLSPIVYLLPRIVTSPWAVDDGVLVKTVMGLSSAAWLAATYLLGRVLRLPRLDALLLSAFATSTGAAMFFLTVPETYALGSVTLLVAFGVVALSERRRLPTWVWMTASAMTLSITVTNWVLGLLATFRSFPLRKAIRSSATALGAVLLLWAVQHVVIGDVPFFLYPRGERGYISIGNEDHVASAVTSLVFHTVVAPDVAVADAESAVQARTFTSGIVVTAQGEPPQHGSWIGTGATLLWVALFGAALIASVRRWRRRPVQVAMLFLLGQLGLHTIYGAETFLYSLNFVTGLLVLIATGLRTWRRPMLGLLAAVTIASAASNLTELDRASDLVDMNDAGLSVDPTG